MATGIDYAYTAAGSGRTHGVPPARIRRHAGGSAQDAWRVSVPNGGRRDCGVGSGRPDRAAGDAWCDRAPSNVRSGCAPAGETPRVAACASSEFSRDNARYHASLSRDACGIGIAASAPRDIPLRMGRPGGSSRRAASTCLRRRGALDGFVAALDAAPHRVFARSLARRLPSHRAAFVVAAAVLAMALVGGCTAFGASDAGREAPAVAVSAQSTPASEWRQGEMPYLYQIDEAWSDKPYAGGTIGENGCGPTALSMVCVEVLGGTSNDPASLAAWSERNGYVDGGATRWAFMDEGAAAFGLRSAELPASTAEVRAALDAGKPVICVVGPGDFTTTGHFIVLSSLNADGSVNVHDPNSPENSRKAWDLGRILQQCNNLWAFEAA